ncbi:RNA polymerase sigma factor [Neorhodopirellula pilleata]|uniref:ECF RNA polymerase sigma factor SigL n=1 Tax=Neorhodopirellula pilleata TaxID=2714738 RepID=A0A5C6AQ21_9BACT|nr:sigma-70 family RNA polymerase sigma factor [Neorhodopirellula pilleata]TWU02045.1 ECF RNA polymerase sigma factor SigL [Neorhodopirellula pilleata]
MAESSLESEPPLTPDRPLTSDSPGDLRLDEWLSDAVQCHQSRLLAYARGILRDRSSSQDAVQETFLQLCHKARQIVATPEPPTLAEFGQRLTPWLFKVCRTRVIDMQRKRTPQAFTSLPTRSDRGDDDVSAGVTVVDTSPTPDDVASMDEEQRRVADSIGTLTPRQREVLQLRIQSGLSYREIAEVTGLTPTNVGFHLHQAVNSLRQTLAGV